MSIHSIIEVINLIIFLLVELARRDDSIKMKPGGSGWP